VYLCVWFSALVCMCVCMCVYVCVSPLRSAKTARSALILIARQQQHSCAQRCTCTAPNIDISNLLLGVLQSDII